MNEVQSDWYEDIEIPGIGIRRLSKFSRKEFTIDFAEFKTKWLGWTREQRNEFAGAFARSPKDQTDNDRRSIIEFLMRHGEPAIWKKIAFLVAIFIERNRAMEFLVARVRERRGPLSNYYHALAKLSALECIPQLTDALQEHSEQVAKGPSLELWENRFVYLDYLYCSAALFRLTGEEQYLTNLKAMQRHNDGTLRQMAETAARLNNIAI